MTTSIRIGLIGEAEEETEVVLFEPAATRNTGNVADDRFTAPSDARV